MSVCYYTMILVMFVRVSVSLYCDFGQFMSVCQCIVYLVTLTSLFLFILELYVNVMTMIMLLPMLYYYFHTSSILGLFVNVHVNTRVIIAHVVLLFLFMSSCQYHYFLFMLSLLLVLRICSHICPHYVNTSVVVLSYIYQLLLANIFCLLNPQKNSKRKSRHELDSLSYFTLWYV